MSALDSARSLNARNLTPQNAAISAAPAKVPNNAPEAKEDHSKAAFSRLLAHSRAAAAAQQPPAPPARSATNPASPGRTARSDTNDAEDNADAMATAAEPRAPEARTRACAPARSGGANAANSAPNPTADAEASAESPDASDPPEDDARPAQADGVASGQASLMAGGPPPAPAAVLPGAETGISVTDTAADAMGPAAAPLATLGNTGAVGDVSATPATGADAIDASFASEVDAKSSGNRGLGPAAQTPAAGNPKAAIEATAGADTLPNAVLAQLAAQALGAGHTDKDLKTHSALDAVPSGAGSAIAGQGWPPLARSIDSPAAATASIATPLGDAGFHEALAAQVSVFARGGLSKAELHLNPAELGPVSVQITMNGDQARVDFGADRAQTRQVIEAGWAELATSLKDAGFTLSGGGVSEQAGRHAFERDAASPSSRAARSADADDVPVASIVAARPRAGSTLDLYA